MRKANETSRRHEDVFRIGLGVNAALAAGKTTAGLLAGSQALVADGVHSLSDIVTNGAAWVAYRLARRPPDDDHHYGHGHIESIAGLAIGLTLVGAGVGIVVSAMMLDAHTVRGPRGVLALAVAVVSIAANLWLARITGQAARSLSSPALTALARDNRSDALTSGLALIGVASAVAGAAWVERAMAFVIGAIVAKLGWASAREAIDVLTDRVTDPALRESIVRTASEVPGVVEVGSCLIHPIGGGARVELEILVDGELSVRAGHEIAHRAEQAIVASTSGVREVHVHVGPDSSADAPASGS